MEISWSVEWGSQIFSLEPFKGNLSMWAVICNFYNYYKKTTNLYEDHDAYSFVELNHFAILAYE